MQCRPSNGLSQRFTWRIQPLQSKVKPFAALLSPLNQFCLPGQRRREQRHITVSTIPPLLLPPIVFSGLFVTLWTYKCLMMIIFQNKIIYMPSMPPFSRSEKVADYINECKPVAWHQEKVTSLDGTKLYLLEGAIFTEEQLRRTRKTVVIVYFQGNGSSLPPRLPYLSSIVKMLQQSNPDINYRIVALSYRGYWQSSGRPTQRGIELDALAALRWVSERYPQASATEIVLWGQSIGAGVATITAANLLSSQFADGRPKKFCISGLLLETPFVSLKNMLISLYPQKFLPYRYLHPFLQSTWDSEYALSRIGRNLESVEEGVRYSDNNLDRRLKVLFLEAGDDELVPKGDAKTLLEVCHKFPVIEAERVIVTGALHNSIMMKSSGKREVVRFLTQFA